MMPVSGEHLELMGDCLRRSFLLKARRAGKSLAANEWEKAFIKANPDAVVARWRNGEFVVERPVKESPQPLIENK
jgi:hypothetical protein